MLWVALDFPGLAPAQLPPLAAWACQFTPRVSPEPPQALLLEVSGSQRYFGGREALLASLGQALGELGLPAMLADAPTARAALWRARSGGLPLDAVPLSAIGTDEAFFAAIGVGSVGELAALPRESLAMRCGQRLLDELDQALGRAPEAREFFAPPERFSAELELPAEVSEAPALVFAARRLLAELSGLLTARQAGVRGFTLTLVHRDGSRRDVTVELASAARELERLSQLLREKLATVMLAEPVEAITLAAADFTPLGAPSRGLFGDRAAEAEDWAELLERLHARLGRDAVYGITAFADHRPEYAWRRVAPGEWDPHDFVPPGPRPAWLFERPRRISDTAAETELVLLAGPERIACGWWDGDEARRDYFVAELGSSLAWVYREEGAWYIHGLFA
ncbi:MAG: DNA polymerase Y family protein [Betaproteobacteria bacterium]|nr:MAG: DNA polymerase Y family protein [Betaproteobacteria bacterium]